MIIKLAIVLAVLLMTASPRGAFPPAASGKRPPPPDPSALHRQGSLTLQPCPLVPLCSPAPLQWIRPAALRYSLRTRETRSSSATPTAGTACAFEEHLLA
jgi:hypothetical protein